MKTLSRVNSFFNTNNTAQDSAIEFTEAELMELINTPLEDFAAALEDYANA